jgi:hypothetical protein
MFTSADYNQALGLDGIRDWEEALSDGKLNWVIEFKDIQPESDLDPMVLDGSNLSVLGF